MGSPERERSRAPGRPAGPRQGRTRGARARGGVGTTGVSTPRAGTEAPEVSGVGWSSGRAGTRCLLSGSLAERSERLSVPKRPSAVKSTSRLSLARSGKFRRLCALSAGCSASRASVRSRGGHDWRQCPSLATGGRGDGRGERCRGIVEGVHAAPEAERVVVVVAVEEGVPLGLVPEIARVEVRRERSRRGGRGGGVPKERVGIHLAELCGRENRTTMRER